MDVRLGITDGTNTELLGDTPLSADTQVVTGMTGLTTRAQANPAGTANPFQPQGFGRGRGRGGPGF